MTDEEYREYLTALARKYLRFGGLRLGPDGDAGHLNYEIERLSSIARLCSSVGERSDDSLLLKAAAHELENAYVAGIVKAMERAGVLAALDEAPDITFGNLRRSVIPEEDLYLLRHAGVEDPDAEITITIQYSRTRFGGTETIPSEIAQQAQPVLKRAGERLGNLAAEGGTSQVPEKKKRKLFNGIGKLLAGTITAAGNLLLATGTIVAPNPATAYGVIASSAVAVTMFGQGIGDLRGE